jgi:hypothetical protein
MFSVKVGKGIKVFVNELEAGHRKSLKRAFRAETFRLFTVTRDQMKTGQGYAKRSSLARLINRNRGAIPFRWAARFTSFVVTEREGVFSSVIGPTANTRKGGAHPAFLAPVLEGRDMKISRARQKRIAAKIRDKRPGKSREFYRKRIPKVGVTYKAPRRDYVDRVFRREGIKSNDNITNLYNIAQSGQSWARDWFIK